MPAEGSLGWQEPERVPLAKTDALAAEALLSHLAAEDEEDAAESDHLA